MRQYNVSPASALVRDARGSARPPMAERERCLSIAHKTRSESFDYILGRSAELISPVPPGPKPRIFKVWEDGSRASFPGIPHRDPGIKPNTGNKGGKRGVVTGYSDASRLNTMKFIATIRRDAEGYTMALTLPGDFESLPAETVHECFKILCNRFTASGLFPGVAFVWKRELQKRGALHYHLLVFGLADETLRNAFQLWMATQWNELVCVNVTEEGKADNLWWHLREENMEKVRGSIESYFAKYVGKDVDAGVIVIPGRWWGKVNGKALPLAECHQEELPDRVAICANRLARKLRQKRADEKKHRWMSRELGLVGVKHEPSFSQFQFLRMKQGHSLFSVYLPLLQESAKSKGLRWGKFRLRRKKRKHQTEQDRQRILAAKYAGIELISKDSPATALRIMEYAEGRCAGRMEENPLR